MNNLNFSRRELARLSGFTLPKVAAAEGRRLTIPALTERQIRHLERYGAFDESRIVSGRVSSVRLPETFNGQQVMPVVVRRRPRGLTRLYSVADVATARLAAWMLAEGLTYTQVVSVLVGTGIAALLALRYVGGPATDKAVLVAGASAAVLAPAEIARLQTMYPHQTAGDARFPIAWLGLSAGSLPGLRRERKDLRLVHPLTLHGRVTTDDAVAQYAALELQT